jgi:hypothetical protein
MQIVIDILEEVYKSIQDNDYCGISNADMYNAVKNGTPLEEHDEEIIKETVASIWGKPPYTDVLDKIRAEIEQKIEQERFARSVFRGEEKDAVKVEQCTGSIFAYNNVIRLIDKYKAEVEPQESEGKE